MTDLEKRFKKEFSWMKGSLPAVWRWIDLNIIQKQGSNNQDVASVIKMIEVKEIMHRQKYNEFVNDTKNVMNGHLIKAETCKEIIDLIKEVSGEINLTFNNVKNIER